MCEADCIEDFTLIKLTNAKKRIVDSVLVLPLSL